MCLLQQNTITDVQESHPSLAWEKKEAAILKLRIIHKTWVYYVVAAIGYAADCLQVSAFLYVLNTHGVTSIVLFVSSVMVNSDEEIASRKASVETS